ncbi:MAG: hypothetical protein FWD44_05950 [Oscillospiraceae bacterium]|nr:hypothetical protein [Oscillospiraceae bacterium]
MELKEQIQADMEMFRQLFDEMDAEGCFNSRQPNDGKVFDEEAEYADLIRYKKGLENPDSLSFWRTTSAVQ